jgi:hypothetical protein
MCIGVSLVLVSCGSSGDEARASASEAPSPEVAEDWTALDDDDALFTVDCPFSHRASDDPIVHYGARGASHSHEFFGSHATDASSTGEGLRGTGTTCEDKEDTAAYWVPTLSIEGRVVDPVFLRAYYRARPGVDVRDVVAPPTGLAMIAGNPDAVAPGSVPPGNTASTSAGDTSGSHGHGGHGSGPAVEGEQQLDVAGWGCGLRPRRFHAAPPTDCTGPSPLTLRLRFPDCWDGRNLDSPDHRSHVARSQAGQCPPTHPVLMTELQVSIVWPVTGEDAASASLSSGSVHGAHGDFLNGWDPKALEHHVELCIHAKANCTIG